MSDRSWMARGRWVDLPTALIIVGWIAVWGLWPHRIAARVPDGVPPGRLVALGAGAPPLPTYARPDLIAIPSPVSFRVDETLDPAALALAPPGAAPMQHFLDRVRRPAPDFTLPTDIGSQRGGARLPFDADPPAERVFADTSIRTNSVYVWMSDALTRKGFDIPAALLAPLPGAVSAAFEIELTVELGLDGQVEQVYVERSCGDPLLDRRIEGIVSRGRAGVAEMAEGAVVISVVKPAGDTACK